MTKNHVRLLATLVVATACSRVFTQPASESTLTTLQYNPPPVTAWLDCVECTEAQRDAVKALGDSAVPELRAVLLSGPPQQRLDLQRDHLKKTYRAMKQYEHEHPDAKVPQSEQQFVQFYMQKYVLLNRLRSVSALSAIGTATARGALKEAQQQTNLPDELKREIEMVLKSPGH